jgi:hypothetical protein
LVWYEGFVCFQNIVIVIYITKGSHLCNICLTFLSHGLTVNYNHACLCWNYDNYGFFYLTVCEQIWVFQRNCFSWHDFTKSVSLKHTLHFVDLNLQVIQIRKDMRVQRSAALLQSPP